MLTMTKTTHPLDVRPGDVVEHEGHDYLVDEVRRRADEISLLCYRQGSEATRRVALSFTTSTRVQLVPTPAERVAAVEQLLDLATGGTRTGLVAPPKSLHALAVEVTVGRGTWVVSLDDDLVEATSSVEVPDPADDLDESVTADERAEALGVADAH